MRCSRTRFAKCNGLLDQQGVAAEQAVGVAAEQAVDVPDRQIRYALEVRHPSFLNPDFIDLLRRYNVAAVVTNSPGRPVIQDVTADFVYVRLHAGNEHHPNGYDEATLDDWAERVTGWLSGKACPDSQGRDVFIYFDNPDQQGIHSPFDALHLQQRVDSRDTGGGDVALQVPLWGW